ncbi:MULTISPECIES: hypothetical protein [Haloferax]|uniref:hypothetical protein n=1 Tax=Haloferax TaxID=2251 RepID=UPI000AEC0755|nr:hypothetical protein [Haloferax mediterranei]MDX5988338.1 hypothetical protein [Haloferax mediterranei ATCC 33500]
MVSLAVFVVALAATIAIEFRERWMVDALLITAGAAVGPVIFVAGRRIRSDRNSDDRLTNAVLAASYAAFAGISLYNAFVLEIMTGPVRDLTMVAIGMTGPAIVMAASRVLGNESPLTTA